jgi:hypothetical protein
MCLLASKGLSEQGCFGLEVLYTEALEQWQEHVTGMRPVSASVIVCL